MRCRSAAIARRRSARRDRGRDRDNRRPASAGSSARSRRSARRARPRAAAAAMFSRASCCAFAEQALGDQGPAAAGQAGQLDFVAGRFEHLHRRAVDVRLAVAGEAIVEQHDWAARAQCVAMSRSMGMAARTSAENCCARSAASAGDDRCPAASRAATRCRAARAASWKAAPVPSRGG